MPITATSAALIHLKTLVGDRFGIKIGVQTKGCSGLAYTMTYAEQKEAYDEEIFLDGVRLLIEPKALLFIIGTSIDYESTPFSEGFIFQNPNEKGKCGCGKSFHV
jgi:iron-sulfur cluster assembly protein